MVFCGWADNWANDLDTMKTFLRFLFWVKILFPILILVGNKAFAQKPDFKVIAFYSNKVESDHVDFSNDARAFFKNLAAENNFTFDVTSDWTNCNDAYLSNYQVVVWLNDFPHDQPQRDSFRKYMEKGGGWFGFHVAGYNDNDTKWPWFVDFLGGGVFYSNSWPPIQARLIVDDNKHEVTKSLPNAYAAPVNEWYHWRPSPRENKDVKVLVTLDPANYPLGIKDILTGGDTPVVWTNTKFNMIYMNMGHGDKVMSDYMQNNMIADALFWLGKTNRKPHAKTLPELSAQYYPKLVNIKGGAFTMGDETGRGSKDELPAHQAIVKDFKIAATETTVAQWRVFCNATRRAMPDSPGWGWHEDHPVINVSWDDAMAYCYWLSEQKGAHYRLPTEAEWEFAAKGGGNGKDISFSGGTNIDSLGWYVATGYGTKPVGTKKPNELGLYDMTGNVWEWVSDWYDAGYYAASPKENPAGPRSGTYKIYRGGAWSVPAANCRVSYRNVVPPSSSNFNRGFRVAAD
jgi:formylglycine-generating enzyme required for sulfatase activity